MNPQAPYDNMESSTSIMSKSPLSPPFPQPVEPIVTLTQAGRPNRTRRLPKRYLDTPPVAPAPVEQPTSTVQTPLLRRVILHVRDFMRTTTNKFGLLREYHHRLSYDPDEHVSPEELANFNTGSDPTSPELPNSSHPPPPWPFENMSKFLLMNWANSGSAQKTEVEITRLGREVLSSPNFKVEELGSFDAHRENKRMDDAIVAVEFNGTPFSRDGWHEVKVDIQVPVASTTRPPPPSRTFSVPGFHYRPLVEVIKAAWSEESAKNFHLSPFKRMHIHPKTKTETRIYDEAYTSDVWMDAHDALQKQPREPGCNLERVIAGLMFWSDSTHLTSFGNAEVWPLYLYFANLSKYIRARPNSGSCHHVAYIPKVCPAGIPTFPTTYILHQLPDNIDDLLIDIAPTKSHRPILKTHCRRELIHEVWRLLLDSEFIDAYRHGIVLTCADGIQRRIYPRIFTYSGDYPEK